MGADGSTGARVAAWQCAPVVRDPRLNAVRLTDAAARARSQGARLVVAPELVLTGYDIGDLDAALVASAVDAVAAAAASAGIAVVAGVARVDDEGRLRNSSVLAESDGTVVAVHDKAQPFGDLDARFVPGSRPVTTARLAGLRVGTLVCYEVELPEPVRLVALAGAELLAVPTANMAPCAGVHDLLVPARALENALPVVYANHVGAEGDTRYLGRSLLVDGDGVVVAEGGAQDEELVVGELAPGTGTQLRDRRPELYTPLAEESS